MKNIFSHKQIDNRKTAAYSIYRLLIPNSFTVKEKSKIHTVANRQLLSLQKNFKIELYKLIQDNNPIKIKQVFNKYYHKVFQLGLNASGLKLAYLYPILKNENTLTVADKEWLSKSIEVEINYFNNFLNQIRTRKLKKYSIDQRIDFYVKTLESQYDAGRIVGSPQHSFIYWKTNANEQCKICSYLAALSPLPKELAITTPKASLSPCKIFCNCSLYIKSVSYDLYRERLQQLSSKKELLLNLQHIV